MRFTHIVAIVFFGLITLQAKCAELITPGSQWQYFNNAGIPGANWYQNDYDRRSWQTGFAEFGYGDGEESTVISFGNDANNKPITQYFAKTFIASDLSIIDALKLRLLADDGAVVYLNGKEVFRFNIPLEANHDTLAVDSPIESIWVEHPLSSSLLQQGENLIAVEVHQVSAKSSDLSFDLALTYTPVNSIVNRATTPLNFNEVKHVTVTNNKEFSSLYKLEVVKNTPKISITLMGGSGDADLYVRYGEPPSLTHWDYRSSTPGNEESIMISPSKIGVYYLSLYSYKAFADVALIVH